jgi:hypothetical protein
MKKIVLLLLGFILGALAMYFYCCSDMQKSSEETVLVKPSGVITPAQAMALDANWTKSRKRAVDSAAGRPDNRSSWWSLEDIQNYLAYAENQADSLGYEMNGIRVYLGVYPNNALDGKADYTTMFIVPTGKKAHTEANFNFFNYSLLAGGGDIPGGDGFNESSPGNPPGTNYPQQQ